MLANAHSKWSDRLWFSVLRVKNTCSLVDACRTSSAYPLDPFSRLCFLTSLTSVRVLFSMPQQANTPFNMFDAFAYHPSPKVNNFRSLLGVFCTVGFLFFQGAFMFTSISGYVFNPPTTEADLVNIHAKEGSIIS